MFLHSKEKSFALTKSKEASLPTLATKKSDVSNSKHAPSKQWQTSLPSIQSHKHVIFHNERLTSHSSFEDIAQYLAEKYLLKPYANDASHGGVKRHFHGVLHAACASYTADNVSVSTHQKPFVNVARRIYNGGLFIELLKKHLPDQYWEIINRLNGGVDLSDEDFLLLKLALFCHDIANTSECFHDEKAHADIFAKEMSMLGFSNQQVRRFANAIARKDAKDDKNILEMIIHDGDCFEIVRVLSSPYDFDLNELDIYKLFRTHITDPEKLHAAHVDISNIVHHYFGLANYLYHEPGVHEHCEYSYNAYKSTESLIQAFKIHRCFGLPSSICKSLYFQKDYSEPLELYSSDFSSKSPSLAKKIFLSSEHPASEKKDMALELYKSQGILIRRIRTFDAELKQLKANEQSLLKHNIQNSKQLKKYFKNDRGSASSLLEGFKFRPATVIKADLPIENIQEHSMGLLISPEHHSVIPLFFYKQNIYSDSITENFDFVRPARAKSLHSFSKIINKLLEINARRCGLAWDNYNRHYGKSTTPHNESLITYGLNSIIGIVVTDDQEVARQALALRLQIKAQTGTTVNFYHYSVRNGLVKVPQESVLAKAGFNPDIKLRDIQLEKDVFNEKLKANKIAYPDASRFYHDIRSSSLNSVSCSLQKTTPSYSTPISYHFTLNQHKDTGVGYVKNGLPIIEINRVPYYDNMNMLPMIASCYQIQLIERCNRYLSDLTDYFQRAFHISHVALVHDDRDKEKVIFKYQFHELPQPDVITMLKQIGYDADRHKWNLLQTDSVNEVQIRLAVPQLLDSIANHLKALCRREDHKVDSQRSSQRKRF